MVPVQRSLLITLSSTLLLAAALTPARVTATPTGYAQGKQLFTTAGCAHCHGAEGVNGERGPDLQRIRNRMSAAQIFTQIHDGSKSMPAFGDNLTKPEIDELVAYLRTKRKKIVGPPPPQGQSPHPPSPDEGF
jgi:mono/diheme cytochrome c family protein